MSNPNQKIVKRNRPKNLNLFTIRLPMPALVSIMHRVSGAFLFLLLPLLLWLLQQLLLLLRWWWGLFSAVAAPLGGGGGSHRWP